MEFKFKTIINQAPWEKVLRNHGLDYSVFIEEALPMETDNKTKNNPLNTTSVVSNSCHAVFH